MKQTGEKNVHDPAEHPMGIADPSQDTRQRRRVSGDAGMRLPYERDETADRQERAGDTDKVMEQAADDAMGPQQDTDRRSDAVENFDHGHLPRTRRGKVR